MKPKQALGTIKRMVQNGVVPVFEEDEESVGEQNQLEITPKGLDE